MTAEDIARQHRAALGFVHTEAARKRGELLEIRLPYDGRIIAFADYHQRVDGQLTIYSIGVAFGWQRHGYGTDIVTSLKEMGPISIVARCPADLPSNGFWQHIGFTLVETKPASGNKRAINTWRLELGGK